jgi:hypothetical protein
LVTLGAGKALRTHISRLTAMDLGTPLRGEAEILAMQDAYTDVGGRQCQEHIVEQVHVSGISIAIITSTILWSTGNTIESGTIYKLV